MTIYNHGFYEHRQWFSGLLADLADLPLDANNGDVFTPIDSQNKYFFNKAGSVWVERADALKLLAGTEIIGKVGIDQTTDGTTNKVQSRNVTHDNFNANANLQVGDTDVGVANPVPVELTGSIPFKLLK